MLTKVWSVAHQGLKAIEVEVEVNVASKGFPGFHIVGLPTKAVEEAKRVLEGEEPKNRVY